MHLLGDGSSDVDCMNPAQFELPVCTRISWIIGWTDEGTILPTSKHRTYDEVNYGNERARKFVRRWTIKVI